MTALEGVKVICLGQFYMGPYATMLMARLGAEVVKIEAPDGDPYRRLPTVDDEGMSVQFQFMNAGKRMMRLDLKHPAGQEVLRSLVRDSDVLVQNLSPGAMERFGLDYEQLSQINPRLIMASGSGFGSFGPYAGEPAMDLTVQARTAVMSTTGFDDGPPVRTGPSVVDIMAGTHLMAGVMTALYQRTVTGLGQHVEVALQDAVIPALTSNIAGWINSGGTIPERTGNRHGGLAVVPYNAFRASDGWITLLAPTQSHWDRLCALIGEPNLGDDRFADMAGRCANDVEVDNLIERWTRQRPKNELVEILQAAKIPCAPVVTLPELLDDPHVRARGVIRRMVDDRGEWITLGSPIVMSDSPPIEPVRAGRLGEHTDELLTSRLGMPRAEVEGIRREGVL